MVDPVQLVLLFVIVILTILLVILGVQVFLILKDVRQTIVKTNRVLDNADAITQDIEGPLSLVSSLIGGFKGSSVLTAVKFIKTLLSHEKDSDDKKHRA